MFIEKIVCDCSAIHRDVLDLVGKDMPAKRSFEHLATLFKAFSDPTRAKILWALKISPMCVCDMAVLLNMTKSAVSHQLKTLRLSNLVRFNKAGKVVYYSLADDHIIDILVRGLEHASEQAEIFLSN